jgi:hypothetical protein
VNHRRRPTNAEKTLAARLFAALPPDSRPAIAEAIRDAERCPAYDADGEQCEGLDGCDECLEQAAQAVCDALEGRS